MTTDSWTVLGFPGSWISFLMLAWGMIVNILQRKKALSLKEKGIVFKGTKIQDMSWVLGPNSALRSSCIVLHWILPLWNSHIIFIDYNGIHPVESGWLHVIYYFGLGMKPKKHRLLFTRAFTHFWTLKEVNSLLLNNSFIKTDMKIFYSLGLLKRKSFICLLSGSQSMFGVLHFNPGRQLPKNKVTCF